MKNIFKITTDIEVLKLDSVSNSIEANSPKQALEKHIKSKGYVAAIINSDISCYNVKITNINTGTIKYYYVIHLVPKSKK